TTAASFIGASALIAVVLGFDLFDARAALRRLTNQPIDSLAVLPLRSLNGDTAQEFVADGMTEQLITTLAQLHGVQVISRTSSMQYKGTSKRVPEIGRELKVDALIVGSVTRSGGRVRISAQLIDARTDAHLWAGSYDRDAADVLALQADV